MRVITGGVCLLALVLGTARAEQTLEMKQQEREYNAKHSRPMFERTPSHVKQSDCSFIRLDQKGPWGKRDLSKKPSEWEGSMWHVPVRDQGYTGSCFAQSAAQMVDAYRFSHAPPEGDTDYTFQTSAWEPLMRAGYGLKDSSAYKGECKIFELIKKYGSCSADSVYYYITGRGMTKGLNASLNPDYDFIDALGDFYDEYEDSDSSLSEKNYKDALCCELKSRKFNGYEDFVKDITSMKWLLKKDKEEFISRLIAKACYLPALRGEKLRRRTLSPKIECTNRGGITTLLFRSAAYYQEALNEKLNFLPYIGGAVQPIAISYCSQVLKRGVGYTGVKAATVFDSSECGGHSSLVIGRRWNTSKNRCEYLIRNSWGTGCDSYRGSGWDCDGGNIWVEDDSLGRNMFDLSVLE